MKEYMYRGAVKQAVKILCAASFIIAIGTTFYIIGKTTRINQTNSAHMIEMGRITAAKLSLKLSVLKTAAFEMSRKMEQFSYNAKTSEIYLALEDVVTQVEKNMEQYVTGLCQSESTEYQVYSGICDNLTPGDFQSDIFQIGLGMVPELNDGKTFRLGSNIRTGQPHLFLPYIRKKGLEERVPEDCIDPGKNSKYYHCTGVDTPLENVRDTNLDYSSRLNPLDWYQKPLRYGNSWVPPYFDDFTDAYLIEYGTTFHRKGFAKPAGVIYVNYDFHTMDSIVEKLDLGETGYLVGFHRLENCQRHKKTLLPEERKYLYEPNVFIHPVWENVGQKKTMYDVFNIYEPQEAEDPDNFENEERERCNSDYSLHPLTDAGTTKDLYWKEYREEHENDMQNSNASKSIHTMMHLALDGYSGLIDYRYAEDDEQKTIHRKFQEGQMAYYGAFKPEIIGEKVKTNDRWGFILFPDQTLSKEIAYEKRILIPTFIAYLLAFILTLFLSIGYRNEWSVRSVWAIVLFSSVLLIIVINLIWKMDNIIQAEKIFEMNPVLHSGSYDDYLSDIEKKLIRRIKGSPDLYRNLEEDWVTGKRRFGKLYYRVPTGVYIQSLKFEGANDVHVSGVVWQKYSLPMQKALDDESLMSVYFPEAVDYSMDKKFDMQYSCSPGAPSGLDNQAKIDRVIAGFLQSPPQTRRPVNKKYTKAEVAYRDKVEWVKQNCKRVIGWSFAATLRQEFNYHKYPLDHKDIWIRLTGPSMKRIVLVPDLASYTDIYPPALPGLADRDILPGWDIQNSFFNYESNLYKTPNGPETKRGVQDRQIGWEKPAMGVDQDFSLANSPELYYHITASRVFINAFIKNLIPLLVVAFILFATLLTITGNAAKREVLGFNHSTIIAACSGLFFTVLLAHIQLRSEFEVEQVLYLEYFNFILYVMILLVALMSFLFTSSLETKILDYRDNLISKVLFWPLIFLFLLLITLYIFWPTFDISENGENKTTAMMATPLRGRSSVN